MSGDPITRQHAEVEAIAAFLDGRLRDQEQQRIIAHLADCEECYELFADTARMLREEEATVTSSTADEADSDDSATSERDGSVLRRNPAPWWRSGVTAAALAAAAAITLLVWSPAKQFLGSKGRASTVAALTASLPPSTVAPTLETSWERHGWPATRGTAPVLGEEEVRAFQLGVRVVEMEVALAAGESALAADLTYDLESRLEGLDSLLVIYTSETGIRGLLANGEPPAKLLHLNREADDLLAPDEAEDYPGFVDGFWYGLGKWSGAAHLAAASGEGAFFAERANRRFLQRALERELPTEVGAAIEQLHDLVARQPGHHLDRIESELEALIAVAGGSEPAASP